MLVSRVNREMRVGMDEHLLTIGFGRRLATYKRADLLFYDLERLRKIGAAAGALQLIYAGKAHPQDEGGKEMIKVVFRAIDALRKDVRVVWLENYDMELG